jgi:hypothetical protein
MTYRPGRIHKNICINYAFIRIDGIDFSALNLGVNLNQMQKLPSPTITLFTSQFS